MEPSQAPTATQASKMLASVPPEEVEHKVHDLVQYLLLLDQKKIPIKRQDINKHVLKEHSKMFNHFIQKAKEKLQDVFGIDLVEQEVGRQKAFFLINKIEIDDDFQHIHWPEEDDCRIGLVLVILSIIFMSDNVIKDDELYSALAKIGVDVELPHNVFGDVKRLLSQDFIRQGYLDMSRMAGTDPPIYEYRWGRRAMLETTKSKVLDFVCQIYEVQPNYWSSQYNDAHKNDAPAAENGAGPS